MFLKKRVQRDDDRLPTHLKKTGFRIKPWTPCGAGQVRNDKLNKTAAVWKAQKDIKKKARGDNKVESMGEWFQYNLISDGVGFQRATGIA